MKFHLLGIGGAGMSVIAHLLHEQGHVVSGSDKADSDNLVALRKKGVKVFVGHDKSNVPDECIIVVSTAINESNPELAFSLSKGLEIWHRSKALAFAAASKKMIAVAGAHGKTTTSGMFAFALRKMGMDPSYAVGSNIKGLGKGGYAGSGDFFVAEADESDKSFLNYRPHVAIVTNIEADHLDNYGSAEQFENIFVDFARCVDKDGALIVCRDDNGALELARKMATKMPVITYGYSGELVDGEYARLTIRDQACNCDGSSAVLDLFYDGSIQSFDLSLKVSGSHNILNAGSVVACGFKLGINLEQLCKALSEFNGTGRRFELRGECNGVRVFDDYAHHPTEIVAVLKQARIFAPNGRVAVIFQPHLFSRTINFAEEFAQSLSLADLAVVVDIFASREEPVEGITSSIITDNMSTDNAFYIPDKSDAAFFVSNWVCAGDIIITVGAGDITFLGDTVIDFTR